MWGSECEVGWGLKTILEELKDRAVYRKMFVVRFVGKKRDRILR